MKIQDIIQQTNVLLQLDLPNALFDDNVDSSVREQETKTIKVKNLVACCNLVLQELASEYAPIFKEETVQVQNKRLNFDQLQFDVQEVFSLKDESGCSIKFTPCQNELGTQQNGNLTVIYSKKISDKTFFEEVEVGLSNLDVRVISYGVCAEYCFMQGDYDNVNVWDSRFKASLKQLLRKKGELKMPKRWWF